MEWIVPYGVVLRQGLALPPLLTLLEILDTLEIVDAKDPASGIVFEPLDEGEGVVSWEAEPEVVVKKRITPLALRRLYETLTSADDGSPQLDRAIEKAISIEKRLRKDAPPTGNTLIFGNFDPNYLRDIASGIKTMFGGENGDIIDVTPTANPGVPAKRSPKG